MDGGLSMKSRMTKKKGLGVWLSSLYSHKGGGSIMNVSSFVPVPRYNDCGIVARKRG
jgi:hypothetical protein